MEISFYKAVKAQAAPEVLCVSHRVLHPLKAVGKFPSILAQEQHLQDSRAFSIQTGSSANGVSGSVAVSSGASQGSNSGPTSVTAETGGSGSIAVQSGSSGSGGSGDVPLSSGASLSGNAGSV